MVINELTSTISKVLPAVFSDNFEDVDSESPSLNGSGVPEGGIGVLTIRTLSIAGLTARSSFAIYYKNSKTIKNTLYNFLMYQKY